jgi:hypothetical protein
MPPGIDAGSEVIATQTACAREDRRATPSSARRAGAVSRSRLAPLLQSETRLAMADDRSIAVADSADARGQAA